MSLVLKDVGLFDMGKKGKGKRKTDSTTMEEDKEASVYNHVNVDEVILSRTVGVSGHTLLQ